MKRYVIEREVPGFGGMFRAPDGSTVMYLKDPSRAAAPPVG